MKRPVNTRIKNIASLAAAAVFCAIAVGSTETEESAKAVASQEPAYTLTAEALYSAYDDNEVAADAKYKGKIVVVSGVIQDIGKDLADDPYVVIGGEGLLDGVQCTFADSKSEQLAGLSKGQNATIKGKVVGLLGNVQVENSSLQ